MVFLEGSVVVFDGVVAHHVCVMGEITFDLTDYATVAWSFEDFPGSLRFLLGNAIVFSLDIGDELIALVLHAFVEPLVCDLSAAFDFGFDRAGEDGCDDPRTFEGFEDNQLDVAVFVQESTGVKLGNEFLGKVIDLSLLGRGNKGRTFGLDDSIVEDRDSLVAVIDEGGTVGPFDWGRRYERDRGLSE